MAKCPNCNKTHRKFPKDCWYAAVVRHTISGNNSLRVEMLHYIEENKFALPSESSYPLHGRRLQGRQV